MRNFQLLYLKTSCVFEFSAHFSAHFSHFFVVICKVLSPKFEVIYW